MKIKIVEKILDKIDKKKKRKSLQEFPYHYKDRYGVLWFNTSHRCSYYKLRKWC